ncbi:MAG: hypothetical protein ACHQ9S_16080 [Candidatus Binatia bacterium]
MSEQLFHGGHGTARLTAHASECDECRVSPLPVGRIAALLDSTDVDIDTAGMSARTLVRLRRELKTMRGMSWRRVMAHLLRALLPLPPVLVVDAYLLHAAYGWGSAILPSVLVVYVVLSYAAFLVFVFGLTYAAVPLLMARQTVSVRTGI